MDNQTHNKNLKDLLNKAGSESFDDFEKEALEGFNTLASEQEALDVKAALDKRIHAEVFTEKKFNLKVYWYAAAGLALIIGLSAYFLMNNNPVNKDSVAIIENAIREETPLDMPKKEAFEKLKDKENAAPPAEEESSENKNLQQSFENKGKEKPSGTTGKYTVTVTDANGASTVSNAEKDIVDEDKKDAAKSVADDYKRIEPATNAPVEISNKDKEGDLLEKSAKVTTAGKNEMKAKKSADRAEVKGKLSDQKSADDNRNDGAALDELAGKKIDDGDREKNRRKSEEKEQQEVLTKQSNEVISNSVALKSEVSKESEKANVTKTPSAPSLNEAPLNAGNGSPGYSGTCYYSGGENNLEKDIREKLSDKKINKKFDAVLYINDKKIVEKVLFTNKYELNKDDEIHIAETLKTLSKFVYSINPKPNTLFEYKLLYRP